MDASCKIQGSIHVFRLVNNMCPGKWVHIKDIARAFLFLPLVIILYVITIGSLICTPFTGQPVKGVFS